MGRLTATDTARLAGLFTDRVAARSALVGHGLAESAVVRRCRGGGPWRRLLPGIVLLHNGRPTERQRIRAALLHAGEPAMLTGVTGARAHGVIRLPDDPRVHVLVPASRQVGSRDFVVVRRTTRLPVPSERAGFPVAPPARCLVDAAARLEELDDVRAMLADAVQRRVCTVQALAAELAEPRRPSTALARRVLIELMDGVRSAAEAWARTLVRRSDLPAPEWNVAIYSTDGRLLAVVDAYWREVGMAWEIDSRAFHLDPAAHARGAVRQSDLAAHGVLVVHTVPIRMQARPSDVLDQLARTYEQAARRPTPPVIARLWRP